jgi:hypothetical protein
MQQKIIADEPMSAGLLMHLILRAIMATLEGIQTHEKDKESSRNYILLSRRGFEDKH